MTAVQKSDEQGRSKNTEGDEGKTCWRRAGGKKVALLVVIGLDCAPEEIDAEAPISKTRLRGARSRRASCSRLFDSNGHPPPAVLPPPTPHVSHDPAMSAHSEDEQDGVAPPTIRNGCEYSAGG